MNAKDITTNGNQIFNIPNTDEGREFARLARKFLNKNAFSSLRLRGRGPNRARQDVTLDKAEWLAAYVYQSEGCIKKGREFEDWKYNMALNNAIDSLQKIKRV